MFIKVNDTYINSNNIVTISPIRNYTKTIEYEEEGKHRIGYEKQFKFEIELLNGTKLTFSNLIREEVEAERTTLIQKLVK